MAATNPSSLLNKIKVTPLASESFGVRSMCTLVETPDITVLLDAGVSLCPYRFNLPPHPIEYQKIMQMRQVIADAAAKASIITISHYHFDHHTPSFEDWVVNWTAPNETARQIYQDKTVLAKNPKENINASQRKRAWMFHKTGAKHAKTIESADGKTFQFDGTELAFSKAVAHGSDNYGLGWVVMLTVTHDGKRFMFAPDVQGPISLHTTELILKAKPSVLMLGGPPLYLEGTRVEPPQINQAMLNLERVALAVPTVVLEHHALRDEFWRQKLDAIFQKANAVGHAIVTAAKYAEKPNVFLESKRKQLYLEHPPSKEFMQWTKTLSSTNIAKPPI
jgi:uncharacterized protein